MAEPTSPLDAYKVIIDELVRETRLGGVMGRRLEQDGWYSNDPNEAELDAFARALTPKQRKLLSRMLLQERDDTIHDVLALLTWWIRIRDVGLSFRGEPMPVELSGMGLHGDYVGRREGWEWPEET